MPSTALLVLNPRDIPECMAAIRALDVPKCFVSYVPEIVAAARINSVIATGDYDRYVLLSDDTVPTQDALDAVLATHDEGHPAVTGYCNLDQVLPFVNLCWNRLVPPPPTADDYHMLTRREVEDAAPLAPTTFAGLSLTLMAREMWQRFPLRVTEYGGQMDYVLSWELQQACVPIVAPTAGFIHHVKERWNMFDTAPEKQLLIGRRPAAVTWEGVEGEVPG